MRLRGVLLMLGLVAGSAAACTLWVDNQFKGYSSNCQLPNANDNSCGQCGTQHCQGLINKTCGQGSVTDDLNGCFADPSYKSDQTNWFCQNYFDDAALNDPNLQPDPAALRHCIHDNCPKDCTQCTDFDSGGGQCGGCLQAHCKGLMDGLGGCCSDPEVASGMEYCASAGNRHCAVFFYYEGGSWEGGSPPPTDPEYCMFNFSQCVQQNCEDACPQ
jgi:hypothetical protein